MKHTYSGVRETPAELKGKCALCGQDGLSNFVVQLMNHVRTPNGERWLIQKWNGKDYGIRRYVVKTAIITMLGK